MEDSKDLISRQAAIEVINAVFPVNPMKSEYAQGIACGAALAKTYVEQLPSAQTGKPDIIVCGDCKYWIRHDRRCGFWNHGAKPLDWCCHAERRTNG